MDYCVINFQHWLSNAFITIGADSIGLSVLYMKVTEVYFLLFAIIGVVIYGVSVLIGGRK